MSEAAIEPELVTLEDAARRLGVAVEEASFLVACGVLEKRPGPGQPCVGARSVDRFVGEVEAALRPNDSLASGVAHTILALRSAWDRALVERGPARPRKVFGAVELGRHPDGTTVFAVEDALDRIVARNLHVLGGGRVRHLIVERALMEKWGARGDVPGHGDVLEHVPPALIARVPAAVARARRIVPVELAPEAGSRSGPKLIVASAVPLDPAALIAIAAAVGLAVDFVLVPEAALAAALERYYGRVDEARPVRGARRASPTYVSFEEARARLQIDEGELKTLVSQGELRGFRDGVDMKFKADDVLNLAQGRKTEPTIILTDSDKEMGIAESYRELVLEDSTTDTVIDIGDIMSGVDKSGGKRAPAPAKRPAPASQATIVPAQGAASPAVHRSPVARPATAPPPPPLALRDEASTVEVSKSLVERSAFAPQQAPFEPEESLKSFARALGAVAKPEPAPKDWAEVPRGVPAPVVLAGLSVPSEDMGLVETESHARLVDVGSDEAMETEAFELMEESGEGAALDDATLAPQAESKRRARAMAPPAPPSGAFKKAESADALRAMPVAPMSAPRSGSGAGAAFGAATMLADLGGAVVGSRAARAANRAPQPPGGMPKPKEDDEAETFERKATVRYYSQMYARRNYPLLVVVSKRSIQKIVKQFVAQVEGKKSFKIRRGNPFVTVRPIVPGCLCVPAEITLDVKPKVAEAKFWITPTAEGILEDARVEVLYEGKVVSTIETPTRVTTQTIAKVSGSAAFFSTSAGPFFDAFGISVKKAGASFLADILADVSGGSLRFGVAGIFAFLALVFFLKRRPKAGPETEGFFDWGVEDEVEGDPLVRAVKAKLLVVGPEGRVAVDLVHATTLIGGAATAHVRVAGARSLPDVACELRYDDTFHLRARSGGIKVNGEELREGEERKLGRDAVIELDSGRVTLWLLDARQDPAVDERRDEVLEKLVQARPSFEKELRAIWKRTAGEPVRVALLEAMKDAFADPHGWQRARSALRI